jgi:uncharacterized protein (TIGR03437 family)
VIRDPVGGKDGYYLLCVIAGDSPLPDGSWQQPAHASIRFKRLESQPPLVQPNYEVETLLNGWRLSSTGPEGATGLGVVIYKRGALPATDCSDPREYRIQTSIPEIVRAGDLPVRICWKQSDKAGNFAEPAVFDFGPAAILPNGARNGASLVRGAVAPGGAFRVDTFNITDTVEYSTTPVATLAGVRLSVRDSAGRTLPALLTTAGPLYAAAVMPDIVTPGEGTVIVQPARGASVSQAARITRTAPGLYVEMGTGAAKGYASALDGNLFPLVSCVNRGCVITQLPLSSTTGGLDFVLYGTGLRYSSDAVRLRIGTHTFEATEVRPHASIAGVDEVHFHLPQNFPVRLYQTVSAETLDGASNHTWIYLE